MKRVLGSYSMYAKIRETGKNEQSVEGSLSRSLLRMHLTPSINNIARRITAAISCERTVKIEKKIVNGSALGLEAWWAVG